MRRCAKSRFSKKDPKKPLEQAIIMIILIKHDNAGQPSSQGNYFSMQRIILQHYNQNETTRLCVTVNTRFYALLVTAFWYLIFWFTEALALYVCWHTLVVVGTTPCTSTKSPWQDVHQELWNEYEQIMSASNVGELQNG